jgi:hypothetical protein
MPTINHANEPQAAATVLTSNVLDQSETEPAASAFKITHALQHRGSAAAAGEVHRAAPAVPGSPENNGKAARMMVMN